MKNQAVKKLIYKKESERSKKEKVFRDVVFYGLVIYVAVLGFMLVNTSIELENAETELLNCNITTLHAIY